MRNPFNSFGGRDLKPIKFVKENFIKKNPIASVFTLAMAISAVIFFMVYLIAGNGRFVDLFFSRCADIFMDFFNSIRDAAQWSEVYTVRKVIYPPMANLIFLILSRFTPAAYNHTDFEERLEWSGYSSPMMLVFLFFLICCLVLFYLISRWIKGTQNQKFIFALFMTLSVPVLYMVERGNLIVLCLIALIIYGATYNSTSRVAREIGLIALAFTFSLKLYPVVFGWFLLVDKRFKDALRCFIYGMIMLIVPSFFFGGPACLIYVFKNIFSFSSGSGSSTVDVIARYLHIPSMVVSILAYAWVLVCAACLFIAPYVHKERWKSWLLCCLLILTVPSLTALYSWAFIIVPFIMLSNDTKGMELESIRKDRKLWLYVVFMVIPFIYIPARFTFYVTNNTFAVYIFTAVLSIFMVVDTVLRSREFVRECQTKGIKLIDGIKTRF